MGFLGFGEKGGGLSSAFKDMTDGGGRGGSGNSYSRLSNAEYQRIGGGAAVAGERPQGYTSIGNDGNRVRTGFGGYGYEDPMTKQWVPFGVDAINGGGAGMAGNRFKGPFAITGLLNMLGVRPQGYDPNAPVQEQGQQRDNSELLKMLNNSDALISNNGQSDNGYQQQRPPAAQFQIPSGAYTPPNQITQTALGPNNMPMPEYLRSLSGRVNRAVAPPNRGR
jgi:hypothetical protein